jgi:hypothetical protein
MDADYMPSNTFIERLQNDFQHLRFVQGGEFKWSPNNQTVTYTTNDDAWTAHLLHEVAHAALNHQECANDAEVIAYEVNAWQYASEVLAPKYNVDVPDIVREDALDTYRDWLHKRSQCPLCQSNGLEQHNNVYKCIYCHQTWRTNHRSCATTRRYVQKIKKSAV